MSQCDALRKTWCPVYPNVDNLSYQYAESGNVVKVTRHTSNTLHFAQPNCMALKNNQPAIFLKCYLNINVVFVCCLLSPVRHIQ